MLSFALQCCDLHTLLYLLIVVVTALVALVSDIFILLQAVRTAVTAPNKDWTHIGNVIVTASVQIMSWL